MTVNTSQLLQLLTLASSNLPVGAYCYSQGVESAIDTGLIHDEASCLDFLQEVLALVLVGYELPMLQRLMASDDAAFITLSQQYLASRESKELLLETQQLAHAFHAWVAQVLLTANISANDSLINHSLVDRCMADTGEQSEQPLNNSVEELLPNGVQPKQVGFLPLFARVCRQLGIDTADALAAYGFSQLENQVLAAVKTVPLGQMAGQRILWQLQQALTLGIEQVMTTKTTKNSLSSSLPNLAILSSQHEVQYSRLFRS